LSMRHLSTLDTVTASDLIQDTANITAVSLNAELLQRALALTQKQ